MLESVGDGFNSLYLGLRQNGKRFQCIQHFYDLQQQNSRSVNQFVSSDKPV